MDWQPIETAPQDRTNILVWCPDMPNALAVFWSTNFWPKHGWQLQSGGSPLRSKPTHWMPLPAPPTLDPSQP